MFSITSYSECLASEELRIELPTSQPIDSTRLRLRGEDTCIRTEIIISHCDHHLLDLHDQSCQIFYAKGRDAHLIGGRLWTSFRTPEIDVPSIDWICSQSSSHSGDNVAAHLKGYEVSRRRPLLLFSLLTCIRGRKCQYGAVVHHRRKKCPIRNLSHLQDLPILQFLNNA